MPGEGTTWIELSIFLTKPLLRFHLIKSSQLLVPQISLYLKIETSHPYKIQNHGTQCAQTKPTALL